MDAAGGQELSMPVLQPLELWQQTGRDLAFGEGLFTLCDRRERKLCLGPTHEEVITQLVAHNVQSYRDLPLRINQWCNVLRWEAVHYLKKLLRKLMEEASRRYVTKKDRKR
jgi:prolyl-tRNA synthetase